VRLLANENVPRVVVDALRDAGHDVGWVRVDSPGATDVAVLERSIREGRLLVTFDKDFGFLAFHRAAAGTRGIVLFRIVLPPHDLARFVVRAIDARPDWEGHFSVVDASRVRMRRLPAPK
jgi:predicted nuclease of predicted toxin-antitoxin system